MTERRTGLFLGAGASFEVGMPLVWELTSEIKSWLTSSKLRELNEGWRSQGGGHPDTVINDVVSMLERGEQHYESILGYIETQFRRRNHQPSQDYHSVYSWLVELVYHTLYLRHVKNIDYIGRHLQYFEGISALATNNPLWVFSLNHDVIIESVAAHFSIPLYTGFGENKVTLPRRNALGEKIGELHAEVISREQLENSYMYFPNPYRSGIYLFKLHGALDVFAFDDGKQLLKILPLDNGHEGAIEALRAANEELIYPAPPHFGGKARVTNEIAYADENGEMQFLRRTLLSGAHKYDKREQQVIPISLLKHFRSHINAVSDLISIGYAFGDMHINVIIREWLEASEDRQLEIVDPAAKDVPSFLLHLAPQVTITRSTATDCLDAKAGITRPRRSHLERQLAAKFRSLGEEAVASRMSEFFERQTENITHGLVQKLKQAADANGGSIDSVKLTVDVASQWANEARGSDDDIFDELVTFFCQAPEEAYTKSH